MDRVEKEMSLLKMDEDIIKKEQELFFYKMLNTFNKISKDKYIKSRLLDRLLGRVNLYIDVEDIKQHDKQNYFKLE